MLLSLNDNSDESYLNVNNTDIFKFKASDNISWYNFCFGGVSKHFTQNEQSDISWNGTVYDFSIDYSSIKKEDIFHIR